MKKIIGSALMVLMFACFSVSAFAGEQADEGNWDFNLAPLYVWAVDMDGDLGVGPINTGVSVPFSDLFDNLEAIFTIHFEGMHRSNWGFFLDYNYVDISASGTQGLTSVTLDFSSTIVEGGGIYRMENGPNAFDMLGGVRYTKLEPDLSVTIIPPGKKFSLTEDWFDPFVGVRYIYDFGNKWKF